MKMHSKFGWTLVLVLLFTSGAVCAKPPTAVSDCDTYITEPGKYRLINDLDCDPGVRPVKILASDVAFDLRGHVISCAVGDRSGVVVGDDLEPEVFSNVRVSNGSINGCAVGVLLWFTEGARVTNISFNNSAESGVTLVEAENSAITKNRFEGDFWAINSYTGVGNRFSHNTVHASVIGIDMYGETDSHITCNRIGHGYYSLSLGPYGQTPSSGNLVRGNLITDSFLGILLYGVGTPDGGLMQPRSADNLIHVNIAAGNGWDMLEVLYDPIADELYPEPGGVCQNTWKNNYFVWSDGPSDCIGIPKELDEVCAMDAED